MTRCDRCDVFIRPDGVAYHVWIWVVARVNDEITGVAWEGVGQAVSAIAQSRGSLPEEMVAADVHCRRSFLLCPSCKERLLANPLGRPWPQGG